MLDFLLLIGVLAGVLEPGDAPSTPHDEVLELEIDPDSPGLIEGRGPAVESEYGFEFSGVLHVHARSELDLFLRVEDANGRITDSAGTSAYVRLEVEEGEAAWIIIASVSGKPGTVELHVKAAPETEATLEAARQGRERLQEAMRLERAGDRRGARELLAEVLTLPDEVPGATTSEAVAGLMWSVGEESLRLDAHEIARAAWEACAVHLERTRPEDDPLLIRTRTNLAHAMYGMGDHAGARAQMGSVVESYSRSQPEDHPGLLHARSLLAESMMKMGEFSAARAQMEAVFEVKKRTLPEDHPELDRVRSNLADTMRRMGDLSGARALQEAVVELRERTLPEDHPELLGARYDLGITMQAMGDLSGSHALLGSVVEAYRRTLPEDDPSRMLACMGFANTMCLMGDLPEARRLLEATLEVMERALPEDHRELLSARHNLANVMALMGDLFGARVLREAVVESRERTLPADHPALLGSRTNLALTMQHMGDFAGARALQEAVLDAYGNRFPEDHPDLIAARISLATTMGRMGDASGALALREAILEVSERTYPEDHPYLLGARESVALLMSDLPGRRAVLESLLEAKERTLPGDHPAVLRSRVNLAATMHEMGDLAGARAQQERVLELRERTLPEDHPDLLGSRSNLLLMMLDMGDVAAALALVPRQVAGIQARVRSSLTLAPRQAAASIDMPELVDLLLFLTRSAGPDARGPVFELIEFMRSAGGEAARSLRRADDPEVAALLRRAGKVRAELGELASATSGVASPGEWARLIEQRDRLEREASRLLAGRGIVTDPVDVRALARGLSPHGVGVGYRRVPHLERAASTGRTEVIGNHLLAHVLLPDETLLRIDLGPAGELERLVTAWRLELGAPLLRGMAVQAEASGLDGERLAGETLRARLLDPILALLDEDSRTLHVCADDLVFLVPLDALPLDEGRVGDRYEIVNEVSFTRLVAPEPDGERGAGLFAIGGVDYDAGAGPQAVEAGTDRPRGVMPYDFARLLQTRFEVETTGALFEELLDAEPVVVTRKRATKESLFEHAPGKRYVHIATHGWFVDERMRSTLDGEGSIRDGGRGFEPTGVRERVTGMAPMLLCGLAFAGANHPADSLGRRTGILTAEELCSLDLDACELAVISACETNVGIRRAGQGIQSLQAALYAAGARSSITSLWKVDDAATRRLMELFYTHLWEEKKPKSEALWRAKRTLREDGAPVRDWSGWVLTGDPD